MASQTARAASELTERELDLAIKRVASAPGNSFLESSSFRWWFERCLDHSDRARRQVALELPSYGQRLPTSARGRWSRSSRLACIGSPLLRERRACDSDSPGVHSEIRGSHQMADGADGDRESPANP